MPVLAALPPAPGVVDWSSEIPVLPSTVLGLELLLQEPVVDLRQTAELILSDLGATLHTLRMSECGDASLRIEECLAGLDLAAWLNELSARCMDPGPAHQRAVICWRHATDIARRVRALAVSIAHVQPDTAYLVGLFHELDSVPRVLGWTHLQGMSSPYLLEQVLPQSIAILLTEALGPVDSPWKELVEAAHHMTVGHTSMPSLMPLSSLEHEATQ